MKKEQLAKGPLLYIEQPTLKSPPASMQSNYRSAPNKEEVQTDDAREVDRNMSEKQWNRRYIIEEDEYLQRKEEEKEVNTNDIEEDEGDEVGFKDMTIEEKVNYLVHTPDYIPKVRCKVITAKKVYHGILTKSEQEAITIRTRKVERRVLLKDITDIQLLGF